MSTLTPALPALPLEAWEPTKQTLHLWAQIVGKYRLAFTPRRNHWWNVPLYVSVRGLTTGRMLALGRELEIELDLVEHRLRARMPDQESGFELVDGLSVAAFYAQLRQVLSDLGIEATIRATPFGLPTTTPFTEDHGHASYDPDAAVKLLRILQWNAGVFEEFAGWYSGKTSPVHLFWHSFDLAVTRFSGRRAQEIPGTDPVTAEAYSHEVISFGFWTGDDHNHFPAYYAYAAPEPPALRDRPLRPAAARWLDQRGGSLALLPYEDVRTAADPAASLLAFLQSSYEAGAVSAGWNLLDTATVWCPVPVSQLTQLTQLAAGTRPD
jgi:hypothetical protein